MYHRKAFKPNRMKPFKIHILAFSRNCQKALL